MTIRRRLLLVVVAAVAAALVALAAVFNIVLARTLTRDAHQLLRARAASQLPLLRNEKGKLELRVGEPPDGAVPDTNTWVFAQTTLLEAPRVNAQLHAAARSISTGRSRFLEVKSSDTLLFSQPVVEHGKRLGTVVSMLPLAPYEKTRNVALVGSVVFAGFVLLFVAAAARWALAAALRPVRRMTRQAADWGENDLDRRFALGAPRDELTELAGTLDRLLDRLATSLRREQRFSAEISHELRTPLARVLGESELALRREREPSEYRATLEVVHRNAEQLTRIVDALVAAARHEAGADAGSADAYAVAHDAAAACTHDGLDVEIVAPRHPVRVGVDADFAARILQPVLENACRYGTKTVRVSIARENGAVRYAVEDDGPGVTVDERERIFEPGVRGSAGGADGVPGSGLGLSLARRLARSVAGDVAATGGARFEVRLPAG